MPARYLVGGFKHAAGIDARQVHAGRGERVQKAREVEVAVDDGAVVMVGGDQDDRLAVDGEVVRVGLADRDRIGAGKAGHNEQDGDGRNASGLTARRNSNSEVELVSGCVPREA